jgi:hypothetical protein
MNILKTTAAALMTSFLIGAASMPAWSASGATQTPLNTQVMLAKNVAAAPLPAAMGWLEPSPNDVPARQDQTNCKPGHVYSHHDTWATRKPASWAP